MSISYYMPPEGLDLTEEDVRPRRKLPVDYMGFARRLTEMRRSPRSTLRQRTREQYVQFCNTFAVVFSEMDIDFDARTFQEACQVVGEENPTYVGKPLQVKSWEAAIRIAEGYAAIDGQRKPVLVQIGKNVAKVFPEWNRATLR
jgi:hypothetical protein